MIRIRKTQYGFSMVEMIVALTITVSLGLAVYTTFSQGLRLWSRAAKTRAEWKTGLFLEKLTQEFRNQFEDPRWIFQGNQTSMSFATMTHDGGSAGGNVPKDRPVYLRYGFDSKINAVTLKTFSFQDVMSPKVPSRPAVPVLEKVRSFEVAYYVYDTTSKGYRWKVGWNKNCFPGTVKVTIEPQEVNGRKITRILDAPAGGVCSEAKDPKNP